MASFGVLILVIIVMTRKPICIDSKLVEKIDRVSGSVREEIYRCDMNKAVRFSSYWARSARDLSARLYDIEVVLDRLGFISLRAPRLVILSESKEVVYSHQSTVYLSEDLFSREGWLERELVKYWLRDKNENLFSQNPLLAEALVENILFMSSGTVDFQKYKIKNNNLSLNYVWPQNLKSSSLECRYLKRFSDNISFCLSIGFKPQVQDVKPYFVKSWMESFSVLRLSERMSFVKSIAEMTPEGFQKTSIGTRFLIDLASRLEKYGVDQAVDKPEFDLVYVLDQKLEDAGLLKKSIQDFSQSNDKLRIAVIDSEKVLFLPSGSLLSKKLLKSWNTKQLIYQSCSNINFNQINSFNLTSDKLLLIRSCAQNEEHFLQKYYQLGASGFASQDSFSPFIHFHLPSLALKSAELDSSKDVFELLKQNGTDSTVAQELGWQKIEWKKELKAYSPRAYVDAIDLFRLPAKL